MFTVKNPSSKPLFCIAHTGLVHVSEMSASRVENASEIVDMGEKIWIKVIGREVRRHTQTHTPFCVSEVSRKTDILCPISQIQGDKVKLSFSMKAVNQGTGQDLDPNNVNGE